MIRALASVSILALPLVASAAPKGQLPRAEYVTRPPLKDVPTGVLENQIIYLNRCVGGCMIRPGADDAATNTSDIASQQVTLSEYAWMPGEWEDIVQCVKEVYSPYNVMVTDQKPSAGFNEIIVAGSPQEIGLSDPGIGGIAIVSSDCTPRANAVSYAFTSSIDVFAQEDAGNRVWGMCWTIAQETAHSYGLDHEYAFLDGRSACNDPMTYRSDCGGQKFFRNAAASCGEFNGPRPGCGPSNNCSTAQNSHLKLVSILGEGTPITAPPVASITLPTANAQVTGGTPVHAQASAQRGVARVELWINGFKWGEAKGAPFGQSGQPSSDYAITIPSSVPDSILDIQVKAFDDLDIEGDSEMVTVTKGAACTTADSCATGQKCENGRCFWDPPSGQFGDSCDYPQFCVSGICEGDNSGKICTVDCIPGSTGACAMGYECAATSATTGVCFTVDSGGCCSVGHESRGWWVHAGLAGLVLGLIGRRRRRR